MKPISKKILLALTFLCCAFLQMNAQTGTISGTVFEESNAEPLMFANVVLNKKDAAEDATFYAGATTDLDGNYLFSDAEVGFYTIKISYIGLQDKVIENIEVKDGEVTKIDISISEGGGQELEEVVVVAEAIRRTENALIALQRKSAKIQDGISSQEMSRFGAASAADAMSKVTGASVLGGRYVYLRGIGDRYNSTTLNGQLMPSTDPYRNATPLDLIPANLLDNLVAYKTFTPDLPGNSTGGSLGISTKSFPDQFTFNVGISTSYNTITSFTDNFLTYEGGNKDWLGYDDGTRSLSSRFDAEMRDLIINREGTIRNLIRADETGTLGERFDSAMKSVSRQMTPTTKSIPMDHSFNLSVGNQYTVFGKQLGFILAVGYDQNYSHYEGGDLSFWETTLSGGLQSFNELKETRSVENPIVSGLFNLAYKLSPKHKIEFNSLYNHNASKQSNDILGNFEGKISGNSIYHSRLLYFQERELRNYQLKGEHAFGEAGGLQIDWFAGLVNSKQLEPDSRVFDNTITFRENLDYSGQIVRDTFYGLDESEFQLPFHFWRDLNDKQYNGGLNLTIPFLQSADSGNKFQFGASYSTKTRDFNDFELQYQNVKSTKIDRYNGDDVAFYGENQLGVLDYSSSGRPTLGLYLESQELSTNKNSYTGEENIGAAYAMATIKLDRFTLIGGARAEQTDITVQSKDTSLQSGSIDVIDMLPSLNVIYALNDKMNIRGAVTKTLARPNMRELSPFSSFDRGTDIRLFGNPDLKRTLITNFDLRWEFYPGFGELIAVSGFLKSFKDPIIKTFNPLQPNKQIKFDNVGTANVYGVEFEFRKSLRFISSKLEHLRLISNVSLIKSVVDIPGDPNDPNSEQGLIKLYNPDKGYTRPFQGQSPFLVNVTLNYNNFEKGLDAALTFNAFGDRLTLNNGGASPDFYEQTIPQLDFSFQKTFANNIGIRFSMKNILNADYLQTLEFGREVKNIESRQRGITIGFGLSYRIR